MKTDNNKNKQMTKKEIKDLAAQLLEQMDVDEFGLTVTENDLNYLSVKIVARMMNIQTMTEWYEHVRDTDMAKQMDDLELDMTEEENALGDASKYVTLMNLFQDKEEYEKCAICKRRLKAINKTLKKY
jgi:hypothetical protein